MRNYHYIQPNTPQPLRKPETLATAPRVIIVYSNNPTALHQNFHAMNRSTLLDLLRISAIALVFVAHIGQILGTSLGGFFGVKNFYYVSLGGIGVSMFLILSGILAGLGNPPQLKHYSNYLIKKILRIYPLYFISLPISIFGYVLGSWLMKGDIPVLFPNGLAVDTIGSLTGFYSWIGLWGGPYNSPSWFIALIMSMYALFPALIFFMRKEPHVAIVALSIISVASRSYVGREGIPFTDPSFYDGVKSWFYRQYGFMPGRPGDWFPLCRLFEFGLGIYLALIVPRGLWFKIKIRHNQAINYFSDLSFALFLTHFPYLFLIIYARQSGFPVFWATVIYILTILCISHLAQKADERVLRKFLLRN